MRSGRAYRFGGLRANRSLNRTLKRIFTIYRAFVLFFKVLFMAATQRRRPANGAPLNPAPLNRTGEQT